MTPPLNSEDIQISNYIKMKQKESATNIKNLDNEFEKDRIKLDNVIKQKMDAINVHMKTINKYSNKLNNGPNQIANQEKIMLEKNNLITTRLLMLENTRQKSSYKQKLVYTTITILFVVIIIMISVYVYKNKKHTVRNFNKHNAIKNNR